MVNGLEFETADWYFPHLLMMEGKPVLVTTVAVLLLLYAVMATGNGSDDSPSISAKSGSSESNDDSGTKRRSECKKQDIAKNCRRIIRKDNLCDNDLYHDVMDRDCACTCELAARASDNRESF